MILKGGGKRRQLGLIAVKHLLFLFIALIMVGSTAARAQYIYYSNRPGSCCLFGSSFDDPNLHIYIYAPGSSEVVKAAFRLETSVFGPEDIDSVEASPGVIIESGDLLSGIVLSFSFPQLNHQPVMSLRVVNNPPHQSATVVFIRDARFIRADGDTLRLRDFYTYSESMIDCFDPVILWECPDTVSAEIGKTTSFQVAAAGTAFGYGFTFVDVADTTGWVTSWSPESIMAVCPICEWDWHTISIDLSVPESTPKGSLGTIILRGKLSGTVVLPYDQERVVLRAVAPVAVKKSSWGLVKSLFKTD